MAATRHDVAASWFADALGTEEVLERETVTAPIANAPDTSEQNCVQDSLGGVAS